MAGIFRAEDYPKVSVGGGWWWAVGYPEPVERIFIPDAFFSQNQEIKNLLHMYTRFTLRMLRLGGRVVTPCYWAG